MNRLLWMADLEKQKKSLLWDFRQGIHQRHGLPDESYSALHRWSVENPSIFWQEVFDDAALIKSGEADTVLENPGMPGSRWFPGLKLNFAENLLKRRDDSVAIIFRNEAGEERQMSFAELFDEVGRIQKGLKDLGVVAGDRVAGFVCNLPETVVAMLAASSLGAIYSSCSPDFGFRGVLDRFGQIEPKVLFFSDQSLYNGKEHNLIEKVREIKENLPSLKALVKLPYPGGSLDTNDDFSINWLDFGERAKPDFAPLPFDHPLYIMYSSGTTGKPKCIVHSAGGTLLAHVKEHRLHCDLKEGDRLFYFTTCGWMMWNWLVSGLAQGATIVLFEGQPLHGSAGLLFRLVEDFKITHFGISPKYLLSVMKSGYKVSEEHDLSSLRLMLSTGAPLLPEHMEFVYQDIKKDLQLASICGGTDIIGSFMQGNILSPVRAGEIQGLGLGLDVKAFNAAGEALLEEKGELVCLNPFPNMPVCFWNDENGEKYRKAYFEKFPGVWTQGDYIEITSEGAVIVYGRSDATLNPGGVRIGTAEIYRVVEKFDYVKDSIVVGKPVEGDVQVLLFVVLEGELTEKRIKEIKMALRQEASPRHVPESIFQVPEVPRTLSGKRVEKSVLHKIMGEEVSNREALSNPDSLNYFESFA
jgi:acetoacetyl-CoA synthetase